MESDLSRKDVHVRASDRERERVVDILSSHAADGRLSTEELEARLELAHGARTRGELAELTADLPAIEAPAPRRLPRERLPSLSGEIAAYVAVNLMLVVIWALTGAGYFWPIWPILGWGIGLIGAGPLGCSRHHRRRPAGTVRAARG